MGCLDKYEDEELAEKELIKLTPLHSIRFPTDPLA